MQAWVLHRIDEIRYEAVEVPRITESEVLVEVKAAGICGSDIPRIYQTGAHRHPLIPGHEFSGTVTKTGSCVNPEWLGKRVGVFPLIPCGKCIPCANKQYEMCRNYDYLGSRRDGGFGEYVAVPACNLIGLPAQVSFETAAMLEPMSVAAHALGRVFMRPSGSERKSLNSIDCETISCQNSIAVYGLGTIGLLLLMLILGERGDGNFANIYAIGNKDTQKQKVMEMGLPEDAFFNSREGDVSSWLNGKTAGKGIDIFFECVGKPVTFSQAVDNAAPGGRICLVGNPASDMYLEKAVYWKILRNQLTITGTWNSSFTGAVEDDWHYVLDLLSRGKIKPECLISHRFPMDRLDEGFHIMRDKTEEYVKIIGLGKS